MSNKLISTTFQKIKFERKFTFDNSLIIQYIVLDSINEEQLEGKPKTISLKMNNGYSATSIKAFNILRIKQHDLLVSILGLGSSVTGFVSSNKVSIISGLLSFIGVFLGNIKVELNDQDAKVLIAIYRLGSHCHIDTIASEYLFSFKNSIAPMELNNSLQRLIKLRTISIKNKDIKIIEHIVIDRNSY